MKRKFSILIPTYNDEQYILETLNSVIKQTYKDWEIILINDGSTDSTEEKIKQLHHPNVKYIYQENGDQLNALKNGSKYITGDFVMLLHSDDLLATNTLLANLAKKFAELPEIDGFYSDFTIIDENSNVTGVLKTANYNKKKIYKEVFWKRGDNSIGDPFIIRKNAFFKWVLPNYIEDNTIYYVSKEMPNLMKIKSWYKYRVFSENYIHSDVGKFVVFNGTQRTIYKNYLNTSFFLSRFLYIPILNKIISKFNLYKLIPLKKSTTPNWKFLYRYYSYWYKLLRKNQYPSLALIQVEKIIMSIEARLYNQKINPLIINCEEGEDLYYGKDARLFYLDYYNNNIPPIYKKILDVDYDYIIVKSKKSAETVKAVMSFYGLYYEVNYEMDDTKKHI